MGDSGRDAGPEEPARPEVAARAEARVRVSAVVRGRVQGVGYRVFVARTATGLGLGGWVANQADGSVRCVAEGDQAAIRALLDALARGPAGARVGGVAVTWQPATGAETGFSIRSGAHPGD